MPQDASTLASASIGALDSALALRKAIGEVRDGFAPDGRLAAYLGSVFDIKDAGRAAACDKLMYAADIALYVLVDIAGNLNCMGGNPIPGAIELSTAPCTASEPLVSNRDDLLRLAYAIADEESFSSAIDLFMRGGDSIDD